MGKVFFTADIHFGHENIIKYTNRPFTNAAEMDSAIIKNWNNAVAKSDTVFVVGDVSFHGKEKTAEIIGQLHGKKILIKGNHDKRNNNWWLDAGFSEVSNYPIIYKEWYVIRHEPPTFYNDATPYFFIYGHVHESEMYRTFTKQTACVSMERWDYTPVNFTKIIELAKLV